MIVELVVAFLLLASGALVLTAALALWRFDDFFLRLHAPALANTLASWAVALASIVFFTAADGRLVLHQWVIVVVLCITVPVSTAIVARATLARKRLERLAHPVAAEVSTPDPSS